MSNKVKAVIAIVCGFVIIVLCSCIFTGKFPHINIKGPNGSIDIEDSELPPPDYTEWSPDIL